MWPTTQRSCSNAAGGWWKANHPQTMTRAATSGSLSAFTNEPYLDFSRAETRAAAQAALAGVRAQFQREHELWIASEHGHKTGDFLNSVNPSKPSEIVGRHHKATAELANRAIEDGYAYFPEMGDAPQSSAGSNFWCEQLR